MDIVDLTKMAAVDAKRRFIAFDLETTGLDPYEDHILEIGATVFEHCKKRRSFQTLVNPGCHIPYAASQVNGITDETVKGAPDLRMAIGGLFGFLSLYVEEGKPLIMCAHNAEFDMRFLSAAMKKVGIDEPAEMVFLDTLKLSRSRLMLENYKLGTVAGLFGIKNKKAHRADGDAQTCGLVLIELMKLKPGKRPKRRKRGLVRTLLNIALIIIAVSIVIIGL